MRIHNLYHDLYLTELKTEIKDVNHILKKEKIQTLSQEKLIQKL
jgi:hypothetical protein